MHKIGRRGNKDAARECGGSRNADTMVSGLGVEKDGREERGNHEKPNELIE